jgi:hypothetical protein
VGTGPMATSTMCMLTTEVRLAIGEPSQNVMIRDGDADRGATVKFQCSVIPAANGAFTVSGRAELLGASADRRGTFSMSGTVAPKATAMSSPNITVALTTQGETFISNQCTLYFQGLDKSGNLCSSETRDPGDGSTICTANPSMDVAAGKIWGSVVCETGMDMNANPPRTCKTAVTFRFENCNQMKQ